jgi:O-acetyl-ADP-ribose deacetylase (regulator of RNase III)
MKHIHLALGDITELKVDAIVNAANPKMLGGGGVDGAIHRAAGPELLAACRAVPEHNGVRCPIGEARITGAGKLNCRYVIHTVGPRYQLDPDPPQLLDNAYTHTLNLAVTHACQSVALPAVSCGVYGYPLREAGEIALAVAAREEYRSLDITFCLFSQASFDIWTAVYMEMRD